MTAMLIASVMVSVALSRASSICRAWSRSDLVDDVDGEPVVAQPLAGDRGADAGGEQLERLVDDVVRGEEAVAGGDERAVGVDRRLVGGVVAVDEGDDRRGIDEGDRVARAGAGAGGAAVFAPSTASTRTRAGRRLCPGRCCCRRRGRCR